MLNSFIFSVLVGAILGFLTGLGTGGGSLLILWLSLVCKMDPSQARNINLMFFIPSAVFATLFRAIHHRIPWKKILLPSIAGCISAALFAGICNNLNTPFLKKIFGLLLLYVGLRELLYKNKKKSGS
jgi:uncharacterized membrane protein YfcA